MIFVQGIYSITILFCLHLQPYNTYTSSGLDNTRMRACITSDWWTDAYGLAENTFNYKLILRIRTVGEMYTPIFSFFGKELSISRFQSWNRSQMKGLVIWHSGFFFLFSLILKSSYFSKIGEFKKIKNTAFIWDRSQVWNRDIDNSFLKNENIGVHTSS